ncbi:hypothetical protein HNQ68_002453 [Pseudochrobactrum saccharolyticum]|uniref:Uncharacterized protein n=1 Tax=Pseudochrobactrum saccharolyticum TaxID=354352 RepID=A0A7W8AK77_9HYPH|nr:hypothetical protein [Pseudochrobactrum saccharolyticum]
MSVSLGTSLRLYSGAYSLCHGEITLLSQAASRYGAR